MMGFLTGERCKLGLDVCLGVRAPIQKLKRQSDLFFDELPGLAVNFPECCPQNFVALGNLFKSRNKGAPVKRAVQEERAADVVSGRMRNQLMQKPEATLLERDPGRVRISASDQVIGSFWKDALILQQPSYPSLRVIP
jgi:hypothetical protein